MPTKSKISKRNVVALAAEIFNLVEYDQSRGFVSDALDVVGSSTKLFGVVRGHLKYSEAAVRKMRRWLRKYGEL